ncbi:Uncharacterised protein [Vibrio cholerae]|nr:Uncharacterised protein [Vibrio cholerae]
MGSWAKIKLSNPPQEKPMLKCCMPSSRAVVASGCVVFNTKENKPLPPVKSRSKNSCPGQVANAGWRT